LGVKLKDFWKKQAQGVKIRIATKLRRGQGTHNHPLKPKKKSNGRPLGFGKTGGGIPQAVHNGLVTVTEEGFRIRFTNPKVGYFHRGLKAKNRPPRNIIGVPPDERDAMFRRLQDEVTKQINKSK